MKHQHQRRYYSNDVVSSNHGMCRKTGKMSYASRKFARVARARLRGFGPFSIYRCASCECYHIGHVSPQVRNGHWDKDDWLKTK